MSQLPPGTLAVEYTVATGAQIPFFGSAASSTASATSATSATVVCGVGTALPASGSTGQLFFVMGANHLFVFTGAGWTQVV
jgi:hypothetical protein